MAGGIFRRSWGTRPRRRRKIPLGLGYIRTVSPTGGAWSDPAAWVERRVPTSNDEVRATASSGNLLVDVPAVCRSIDLTGYTAALDWVADTHLTVGSALVPTGNVAAKFPATGASYFSSSAHIRFSSSSGASMTVDMANGAPVVDNIEFDQGAYTLTSALAVATSTEGILTIGQSGGSTVSLNTAGFSINCQVLELTDASATLTLGASAVLVQEGLVFDSAAVLNAGTSLISMTGSTAYLNGGGHTFYDVTFGAGVSAVTGSNTFHDFIMEEDSHLTFDASSTSTFTSFFSGGPTSGSPNSIVSSSPGTFYTFTDTTGTNTAQYTSITDSHAGGGATWDATDHDTDGGGNTGWNFGVVMKFIPWITQDVAA